MNLVRTVRTNLRILLQIIATVYIAFIGVRFFLFVKAMESGDISHTRPLGVEGFLPISALLSLKQLIFTGQFDTVHAAGFAIFMAAILMSIIFKKSFCSHICPVGLASETVSKVGIKKRIPAFIPVWAIKYILLGFFIYAVFIAMDLQSVQSFIKSPYNIVSDAKMMYLFLPPSKLTIIVILSIFALTLIFRNFWCKYLCPYGALTGLMSVLSPCKIKRDANNCTDCKACTKVCPASINVHSAKIVHNPDCIGCHDCINTCPTGCLTTTTARYRWYFPLIILLIFLAIIGLAMATGHWESSITNQQYMRFLMMDIPHP